MERKAKQERSNKKKRELKLSNIKCKLGYNKIITEKEVFYWNEKIEKWFRRDKEETHKTFNRKRERVSSLDEKETKKEEKKNRNNFLECCRSNKPRRGGLGAIEKI